jgi:hypothetical protein
MPPPTVDSPQSWQRLALTLVLSTIGGVGMWSVVVALPSVQAEFAVARAGASFPYTMTMLGFGAAGMVLGPLVRSRRHPHPGPRGVRASRTGLHPVGLRDDAVPVRARAGPADRRRQLGHVRPLLAHVSMWFERRRGIAVAIVASGNYFAGPCGRRSSSTSSRPRDGARPTSASACSCSDDASARAAAARLAARARVADGRSRPVGGTPASLGLSPQRAAGLLVVAASRAASRCRCRKSTSSRTARTWATAPRAARRCCR